MSNLSDPKDVMCDDMGVWRWKGSYRRWLSVDEKGCIETIGKHNFTNWFQEHGMEVIANYMIPLLREKAGLGSAPGCTLFTPIHDSHRWKTR